jgi:uncharacterized protein YcbX
MPPRLARIAIYPIKSFDASFVTEATLQPKGNLAYDRRFALLDLQGQIMNGKRSPRLQQIRARFSPDFTSVTLSAPDRDHSPTFHLPNQGASLAAWVGKFVGEPLLMSENSAAGFPDDLDYPGPTIISTATLETVAGWFDLSVDETRARFRANLEIDGVEPFWEDRLVPDRPGAMSVHIGSAELLATNACIRCVVPTRDSKTGERTERFVARFGEEREASLPAWAPKSRFDTFYRLAVNAIVAPNVGEQSVKAGDSVEIGGFCTPD